MERSEVIELALIFAAGFGSVFMLGFQSRNVNHGNFGWAACTSFAIAQMQTTLWGQLFSNLTWSASLVYGLSGACGITLSMYVHKRWIARDRDRGGKDG
jgi:hypothetical protein